MIRSKSEAGNFKVVTSEVEAITREPVTRYLPVDRCEREAGESGFLGN